MMTGFWTEKYTVKLEGLNGKFPQIVFCFCCIVNTMQWSRGWCP